MAARPGKRGNKTVSAQTIRHNWGCCAPSSSASSTGPTPTPRAIFAGDLPKADEPTPKFLDDPTAAKFMAALATDPKRRRRLIVEPLARTGMRAGELGGLRDDAMYRLGDTYWLRIPLGKLHNDRSVPLHPLLEAIAALLGHRSPRMTLLYARIADTVVAEQYFSAIRGVEADTQAMKPLADERAAAARHRRLLGNGHCTRPLELDCRFQTICEGCGFFETGPEFITILRRQRDDAADHTDLARTRLNNDLVRVIDNEQPAADISQATR